jgi:hypothetical protein
VESQLEQEELRRRLRAARELRGVKTIKELAELCAPNARLGERTLRKLESGESVLTPPILRELAATLDLPYAWFTVPDLGAAVGGQPFEDRLSALEAALGEVWNAMPRDEAPTGAARHVPPLGNVEQAPARRRPRPHRSAS